MGGEEGEDRGAAGRQSILPHAAALYRMLPPPRRRQLFALLAAMLAGAAAEMLAIAAVLPFAAAVAGAAPPPLAARFGGDLLFASSVFLIVAVLLAAAGRLALMRLSQGFAVMLGHDIGVRIFGRMLRQPYARYLERNSSDILSGLEKTQTIVASMLMPLIQSFIALVLAAAILALLAAISPVATALAAVFAIGAYGAASAATRGRLLRNSDRLAHLSRERIRAVQEALGGIRDILLDRTQPVFEERFRRLDHEYRRAQAANLFMAGAPRYLIEAAGIVAIAAVALAIEAGPARFAAALPTLAALALGAQRLLPLLQQAYVGWSQSAGNVQALADVVALTEMPVAAEPDAGADLPFEREIAFDRVSFSYRPGAAAVRDLTFSIAHGARIGIAGRTGSGKSTLIDLLMGLIEPGEGEIGIDGRPLDESNRAAWQRRIAHVPQAIYLADDSVAANIAFGVPAEEVDELRLREAARAAQLDECIAGLPRGFATRVGERGVRLSGGERQRIGIARALYRRADLLVLDEATSALDEATEAAVIASIAALRPGVTLVKIAHRPAALRHCERILRLDRGRLVAEEAK